MLASKAHKLDDAERTKDVQITENINFEGLLLSEPTLAGLAACGFEKPSPIQFKAIPFGKCGFDLIAQAKSGTGKTCMFGVIALEMLQLPSKSLQVLVLAPTREIAAQVADVISSIGQGHDDLKVATFIGGMPLEEDRRNARTCHVAVGSPGRVKQLIDEGVLKVDHIRLIILDEADKLLETGFLNDINHIFSLLPVNKQTLAASATYTEELKTFLEKYMRSPLRVSPDSLDASGADSGVLLGVRQCAALINFHPNMLVKFRRKLDALVYILSNVPFKQCLVFNNMHGQAETISKMLIGKNFPTEFISGHMDQPRRLQAISRLVDFKCSVLLSTDLSARGLDAANVNLVINMDIPKDEATYLHRVGRAGRFGTRGLVITLSETSGKDVERLQNITEKTHNNLECFTIDTKEPLVIDLWSPCPLFTLDELVDLPYKKKNVVSTEDIKQSVKTLENSALEDKVNGNVSESKIKAVEDGNVPELGVKQTVEVMEKENGNVDTKPIELVAKSVTEIEESRKLTESSTMETAVDMDLEENEHFTTKPIEVTANLVPENGKSEIKRETFDKFLKIKKGKKIDSVFEGVEKNEIVTSASLTKDEVTSEVGIKTEMNGCTNQQENNGVEKCTELSNVITTIAENGERKIPTYELSPYNQVKLNLALAKIIESHKTELNTTTKVKQRKLFRKFIDDYDDDVDVPTDTSTDFSADVSIENSSSHQEITEDMTESLKNISINENKSSNDEGVMKNIKPMKPPRKQKSTIQHDATPMEDHLSKLTEDNLRLLENLVTLNPTSQNPFKDVLSSSTPVKDESQKCISTSKHSNSRTEDTEFMSPFDELLAKALEGKNLKRVPENEMKNSVKTQLDEYFDDLTAVEEGKIEGKSTETQKDCKELKPDEQQQQASKPTEEPQFRFPRNLFPLPSAREYYESRRLNQSAADPKQDHAAPHVEGGIPKVVTRDQTERQSYSSNVQQPLRTNMPQSYHSNMRQPPYSNVQPFHANMRHHFQSNMQHPYSSNMRPQFHSNVQNWQPPKVQQPLHSNNQHYNSSIRHSYSSNMRPQFHSNVQQSYASNIPRPTSTNTSQPLRSNIQQSTNMSHPPASDMPQSSILHRNHFHAQGGNYYDRYNIFNSPLNQQRTAMGRGMGYNRSAGQYRRFMNKKQAVAYLNKVVRNYKLPPNDEVLGYDDLEKLVKWYIPNKEQMIFKEAPIPNFDPLYFQISLQKSSSRAVVATKQKFVKHGGIVSYLTLLADGYESDGDSPENIDFHLFKGDYQPSFFNIIERSEWVYGYRVTEDGTKIKATLGDERDTVQETNVMPQTNQYSTESDKEQKTTTKVTKKKRKVSRSSGTKKEGSDSSCDPRSSTSSDEANMPVEPKTTDGDLAGEFDEEVNVPTKIVKENDEMIQEDGQAPTNIPVASSYNPFEYPPTPTNPFNTPTATGSYNPFEYPPIPTDPSESLDVWKQQVKLTTFMIHYAKYLENWMSYK